MMSHYLRVFFSVILSFTVSICFSQNKELELRNLVKYSKDSTLVEAYLNLAKYYYQTTGKGDSLLLYGNKALKLSQLLKNENQVLEALKYSGVGHLVKKEFDKAEALFKSSLNMAIENNDLNNQANLHNKLGALYQNKGEPVLAVNHLINAAKYSEKIEDYKNVAQAYYGISHIYANQEQFKERLKYIEKALFIIENNDISDPLMESIIFSFASQQYVTLYYDNKDSTYLENAYKYANKTIDISKKHNFKPREISAYSVLSFYYYAKKDYSNSELFTKKVLKNKHLVNEEIILNAYFRIANKYKLQQQKSLVYAYIDTLNSLKLKSDPRFGSSISKFSYENYSFFKDYQLALKALEEMVIFDKQLFNEENSKLINELHTKYKTELKDAEINNLNQKQKINELEIINKQAQLNKLVVLSTIGMFIFILILFIFKRDQLKKTRQKNYELKLAFDKQIQLEKELSDVRDDIAQDFHDDLGNKLARISLLSNLISGEVSIDNPKIKSKVKQITEDANGLYRGTRDFIFSLKSNSDYIEEVATYLSDFGEDFFKKTKVKFVVKKNILTNDKLPHYWNKQLIFIFKEALTNALKHSNCDLVTLTFAYSNHELTINCHDNGKGISKEFLDSQNGITNMKNRAKKIGGLLAISSEVGKGTTITFTGKTNQK